MNDFTVVTVLHDNLHGPRNHVTRLYIGCSGPAKKCAEWCRGKNWCTTATVVQVDANDLAKRDEDEVSRAVHIMRLFGNWVNMPKNY